MMEATIFQTYSLEKHPSNSYIIMQRVREYKLRLGVMLKLILIVSAIAVWFLVNIYVFPKLGIRT